MPTLTLTDAQVLQLVKQLPQQQLSRGVQIPVKPELG